MDDHEDFDSVSWQRDAEPHDTHGQAASYPPQGSLPVRSSEGRRTSTMSNEPQAGEHADAVDLAGIGPDGVLECSVDSPLKENDGTKDAYVSYLVTTHVCIVNKKALRMLTIRPDRLQILSKIRILRSKEIYRFPLPSTNLTSRISGMRDPTFTREE